MFNGELAFYKDPKTDEFIDEWTNPMTVADWPRESPGPVSRLSEIFQRACRIADLDDPALTSVPSTATWTRIGPWLP